MSYGSQKERVTQKEKWGEEMFVAGYLQLQFLTFSSMNKFSFIHRASNPLLFLPAATVSSQTSAPSCCCVVLHPTHSFPPLLHAAFCMTSNISGNFICPPAYTMEALQALLFLRFQCPWSTASSFFFPSLALSLPQLGYGLTLLHDQRLLKLLLCLSCQQFTSHWMFILG